MGSEKNTPKLHCLSGEAAATEAEQRFIEKALEIYRRTVRAGHEAPVGEVFDTLHAVVVDEGPGLLADLTEAATKEVGKAHEEGEHVCGECKKKRRGRSGC